MIKEILSLLWTMNICGSFVILLVLVLRLCFSRAPKIFSYILWLAVLLRFLCPVALESDISALGIGQKALSYLGQGHLLSQNATGGKEPKEQQGEEQTGAGGVIVFQPLYDMPSEADGGREFGQTEMLREEPERQTYLISRWADRALFMGWIAGMVVILCYTLLCDLRLTRYLKNAVRQETGIYVKEGIPTPFVRGVISPRIYLPEGLGEREKSQHPYKNKEKARFFVLCIWYNKFEKAGSVENTAFPAFLDSILLLVQRKMTKQERHPTISKVQQSGAADPASCDYRRGSRHPLIYGP